MNIRTHAKHGTTGPENIAPFTITCNRKVIEICCSREDAIASAERWAKVKRRPVYLLQAIAVCVPSETRWIPMTDPPVDMDYDFGGEMPF